MSSIIETPPFARTIHSLSLVDPKNHKSIRVPCRTPENGLEAVEMKEIFGSLTDLGENVGLLAEVVEQQRLDLVACQKDLATCQKDLTAMDKRITDLASKVDKCEKDILTIDSRVEKNTTDITTQVNRLNDIIKKYDQEIADLKAEDHNVYLRCRDDVLGLRSAQEIKNLEFEKRLRALGG